MEYKKKTDEEILALAEEFQKESLFRAYCDPFWSAKVDLSVVEIWAEAKELLPKLIKKREDSSALVATYQSIYRRRYTSLFKHLPSAQEQMRKSEDVCSAVFATLCRMCYHCMLTNGEIKHYLTFDKPIKKEGYIVYIENMSPVIYENVTIKNLLECLEYYIFQNELMMRDLLRAEYIDKKRNLT